MSEEDLLRTRWGPAGKYRLTQMLGKGSFGSVYKANVEESSSGNLVGHWKYGHGSYEIRLAAGKLIFEEGDNMSYWVQGELVGMDEWLVAVLAKGNGEVQSAIRLKRQAGGIISNVRKVSSDWYDKNSGEVDWAKVDWQHAVDQTATRAQAVAVKFESESMFSLSRHCMLFKELSVLKQLNSKQRAPGFCQAYWDGWSQQDWDGTSGRYHVLVMDALGLSLEHLFNKCGRRFDLKTVLLLAKQMIERVRYMHSKNLLHRDIKPDNFCMGQDNRANIVHLIDFGLSNEYKTRDRHILDVPFNTGLGTFLRHICIRYDQHLIGTARYCSLNVSQGIEPSRRDDLEAIGYCMIYFLSGKLPWMGLKAHGRDEKFAKIRDCKERTKLTTLCQGLPDEFHSFLDYCRKLGFSETPDYKHLQQIMKDVFEREGFAGNNFQWQKHMPTTQDTMVAAFIASGIMENKGTTLQKAGQKQAMARPAFPGEQVATIINGAIVATTEVSDEDAGSMVVRLDTDDHECFVLDAEKFQRFFVKPGQEIEDDGEEFDNLREMGFKRFSRKGSTIVYQVTKDDMQHVPSGGFRVSFSEIPQPLQAGDYIATPGDTKDEVYLYKHDRKFISQPTSQEAIIKSFLPILETKGTLIKKTGMVSARPARKGEVVATVIDGKLTSQVTVVDDDSMVVLISSPGATHPMRLLYSGSNFDRFFTFCEDIPGEGITPLVRAMSVQDSYTYYQRKGETLVYQVTHEDIMNFVPSGEFLVPFSEIPQPLQAGNYIATPADSKDEVYLYSRASVAEIPAPSDMYVNFRPKADCEAIPEEARASTEVEGGPCHRRGGGEPAVEELNGGEPAVEELNGGEPAVEEVWLTPRDFPTPCHRRGTGEPAVEEVNDDRVPKCIVT